MIRRTIKKVLKTVAKPFKKVSYVNNYIYKGELLKGRTALITGGTSGIGFSIAKSFLQNGCNVIITGRNQERIDVAIRDLSQVIKNKNVKIYGYEFDISDIKNISKKFEGLKEIVGNDVIDILVNNAGVLKGKNIGETEIEEYEMCFKTNLEGVYFLSQTFYNYLKEKKKGGNILNICSSSSMRPAVKPYTLTKWGMKGLTIGMAKKFIKDGIVVNGIAPGVTYTPMLVGKNIKEKDISLDSCPAGRYIMPEEIANGALFLVSDMGKMIVGDIMYMTGGAGVITVDDISY